MNLLQTELQSHSAKKEKSAFGNTLISLQILSSSLCRTESSDLTKGNVASFAQVEIDHYSRLLHLLTSLSVREEVLTALSEIGFDHILKFTCNSCLKMLKSDRHLLRIH
jgi:hypothetical protein